MMLGSFQLLLGMPKFAIRATASFLFQAACNRIFSEAVRFLALFSIFSRLVGNTCEVIETAVVRLCQQHQRVQRDLTNAFLIPVVGVRVTENLPRCLCHRVTAFQTELFQPDQHFLPLRRFFYFSVHE